MKKRLISLALVFHLLVILIFPVSSSPLWSYFAPLMVPYANALGVNSTWQFFAPEPESWIFMEYEIEYAESPQGEEFEEHRTKVYKWPPPRKFPFDPFYTRSSSIKAFVFAFPRDIPLTFGRWMCKQHPEAYSISFRRLTLQIPTFENIRDGHRIVEENSMITDLNSVVCADVNPKDES